MRRAGGPGGCRGRDGFAADQSSFVQGGGSRLRCPSRPVAAAWRLAACARRPGTHGADQGRARRLDRDRPRVARARRAGRPARAQRQHRAVRRRRERQGRHRRDAARSQCGREQPRAERTVAARGGRLQRRRPDRPAAARARGKSQGRRSDRQELRSSMPRRAAGPRSSGACSTSASIRASATGTILPP